MDAKTMKEMIERGDVTLLRAMDLHLAVVTLKRGKPEDGLATAIFYGTAFPILPGVFATAAHVAEAAQADGHTAVARLRESDRRLNGAAVDAIELYPHLDFALLFCDKGKHLRPMPIIFEVLSIHDPVSAMGYPFAFDVEWVNVVPRGFRGHIVTRRELLHLKPSQPPGYELSFPTPKGMSGAPLIVHRGGALLGCNGWIIQQQTLRSRPAREQEEEALTVGIAVCATSLLSIESARLGHLADHFGLPYVPLDSPTQAQRPGGMDPPKNLDEGWPDLDDMEARG